METAGQCSVELNTMQTIASARQVTPNGGTQSEARSLSTSATWCRSSTR